MSSLTFWQACCDELEKEAAATAGQWWDSVGGPHLAKGGSHKKFKKMMRTQGLPEGMQAKLLAVASRKYPEAAKPPVALGHGAALGVIGATVGAGILAKKVLGSHKKEAAGAPTRGGFMMASDMPAFKPSRLDRAIQKEGELPETKAAMTGDWKAGPRYKLEGDAVIEVDEKGKSLGKGPVNKEKDSAFMPDGVTYSPGDFRKSKYAASTAVLASFVAEVLAKEASFGSPAAQLAKTQRVGAPKVSAPPGPSIADIAKPRGAKFGVGIPGAFKTGIG